MNEVTFCTIAFRDDPIEDVLPKAAAIGYDNAEVFWGQLDGKSDEELRAVRAVADDVGLPVLILSPYLSFTQGSEAYEASMERVEAVVNAARILGASKIRTFTDVGPTGIGSDVATEQQWAACVEGLKTITSANPDLTFVLETHPKTLADNAASVRRLMGAVNAPNLKLLLHPDADNDLGGMDGFNAFADVVDHLHLKNRTPDGEATWVEQGVFDVPAFLDAAQAAGYEGSASVEYCWRGATWELAKSAYKHVARRS